jgi:glutaminyl-tRNA synthetase
MVETGFYPLAKRMYEEALAESKSRLARASTAETAEDVPHATIDQLVGPECVRFQGLRVAYFALDSDARMDCLGEPSRQQGDYIVLNRIVGLKEDSGK